MKKCPECQTDCAVLAGRDGREYLAHITDDTDQFPKCAQIAEELVKSLSAARVEVDFLNHDSVRVYKELVQTKRERDGARIEADFLRKELKASNERNTALWADYFKASSELEAVKTQVAAALLPAEHAKVREAIEHLVMDWDQG